MLIDQPEVQPDAARLLSARGVGDRCDFVGGSFFDPMATTGEVWAMCQVLHDWPDAECRAILSRCRERMRETDRLLVIEMLTVPGEPNPGIAVLDMMMLLYFGEARQRTVAEYQRTVSRDGPGVLPCGVHVQRIQHRRSATRLTERRSALGDLPIRRPEVRLGRRLVRASPSINGFDTTSVVPRLASALLESRTARPSSR